MEIYSHCPICEKSLSSGNTEDEILIQVGGFEKLYCLDCQYEYRQQGSYASLVILDGQQFWFDDGYSEDDQKKFDLKVQEIKNRSKE